VPVAHICTETRDRTRAGMPLLRGGTYVPALVSRAAWYASRAVRVVCTEAPTQRE